MTVIVTGEDVSVGVLEEGYAVVAAGEMIDEGDSDWLGCADDSGVAVTACVVIEGEE